jgi:hypothetical protein
LIILRGEGNNNSDIKVFVKISNDPQFFFAKLINSFFFAKLIKKYFSFLQESTMFAKNQRTLG